MILICLWQLSKLVEKGQRKETIVFSTLWFIAVVYGSLLLVDVPLISPMELIIQSISILELNL
jgi:hypothetical protein